MNLDYSEKVTLAQEEVLQSEARKMSSLNEILNESSSINFSQQERLEAVQPTFYSTFANNNTSKDDNRTFIGELPSTSSLFFRNVQINNNGENNSQPSNEVSVISIQTEYD